MATGPVLLLLVFDLLLFLGAAFYFDRSEQKWENLLLSTLFLFSGMPALIYQVVWQRALFSIYGVNAESVAIVVSAFMLGLGSLAGEWLSARFPPGHPDFWTCRAGNCTFRARFATHFPLGRGAANPSRILAIREPLQPAAGAGGPRRFGLAAKKVWPRAPHHRQQYGPGMGAGCSHSLALILLEELN